MMRLAEPLPPGATIGILGGGQLGRMLALAAARLGLKCHVYAPETDSPAFQLSTGRTSAAYEDLAALDAFARQVGVVTYEFENVPGSAAAFLDERVALAPGVRALETAQDRLIEKSFLAGLGIPVAPFAAVNDVVSLRSAMAQIGTPSILKTRRFGYDGKGQIRIGRDTPPENAWTEIGQVPAILERFVTFEKEISVIAARGWTGDVAVYDVPENQHENHILRRSIVPAGVSPELAAAARDVASEILAALDHVGVIGVEMFVVRHGGAEELIVNEIAPRVHNSGHWTIDACAVSQFEQHIRAVAGWPLGSPSRHSDVVMSNLIGDEAGRWRELASEPGACLHLYGKTAARTGRKMGHVNRLTPRHA